MKKYLIILLIVLSVFSCKPKLNLKDALIIKNGLILDLTNNGKSFKDLKNKAIIIKSDTIFAITDANLIPKNHTNIIDAKGKYIMSGLTDGFTVINNQSYANALLYLGITNVIGVDGSRRGKFFHEANPTPNVYMLREVGEEKVSDSTIIKTIKKHHEDGVKTLLIMYGLTPSQVKLAHTQAKKYGMGTIGELGYTSYKDAMNIGVDVFVHTTRYSLDIAPDSLVSKVAAQPFSNDLGSPKWQYYQLLTNLDATNVRLKMNAKNLGKSNSYIQPTFALLYLDMDFSTNPWKEKIAKILDAKDINRPANKITGKHDYPKKELEAYQKLGRNVLMIEKTNYQNGAKYLSGSATDVWGTMPGISLHQELEVLHRIGLSNREVLASSTSNFSDAYGFKFGKIKTGFKANLLILDHNPLENIKNLKKEKMVILNGKILNLEQLLNVTIHPKSARSDYFEMRH